METPMLGVTTSLLSSTIVQELSNGRNNLGVRPLIMDTELPVTFPEMFMLLEKLEVN